jgi:hypothetical protein
MGESNLKDTVDKRLAAMGLSNPGELELSDEQLDKYDTEGFQDIELAIVDDEEDEEMADDE